jgi:hypothetical protein
VLSQGSGFTFQLSDEFLFGGEVEFVAADSEWKIRHTLCGKFLQFSTYLRNPTQCVGNQGRKRREGPDGRKGQFLPSVEGVI